MTELEKAYIAGIIDGEGSIMLQKSHKNECPSPCVSVASTTLELLNWLKDKIGGGKIIRKNNYNPDKHSDCYSYVLKYNEEINLIEEIYPYLIIESKKRRASLILEKYNAVPSRNGRYSEELSKAKNKFYEDFISIK